MLIQRLGDFWKKHFDLFFSLVNWMRIQFLYLLKKHFQWPGPKLRLTMIRQPQVIMHECLHRHISLSTIICVIWLLFLISPLHCVYLLQLLPITRLSNICSFSIQLSITETKNMSKNWNHGTCGCFDDMGTCEYKHWIIHQFS